MVPYCPLILKKGFVFKNKPDDPILEEAEKRKRKRRGKSDFKEEADEARSRMHEKKVGLDEDIPDDSKTTKTVLEDDCVTADSIEPQSIALSSRYGRLYILLLRWLGCRIVILGKSIFSNPFRGRGCSMP